VSEQLYDLFVIISIGTQLPGADLSSYRERAEQDQCKKYLQKAKEALSEEHVFCALLVC
jgi:hypothetical protein